MLDLAEELGVTESRVCQMKHEALSLLRRRLETSVDLTDGRTLAAAAC